jgi:hypothetical protein
MPESWNCQHEVLILDALYVTSGGVTHRSSPTETSTFILTIVLQISIGDTL